MTLLGTTYESQWDNWYGPSGRDYEYNVSLVEESRVAAALKAINKPLNKQLIKILRNKATIECGNITRAECHPVESPCLFNIAEDPCELNNLADK